MTEPITALRVHQLLAEATSRPWVPTFDGDISAEDADGLTVSTVARGVDSWDDAELITAAPAVFEWALARDTAAALAEDKVAVLSQQRQAALDLCDYEHDDPCTCAATLARGIRRALGVTPTPLRTTHHADGHDPVITTTRRPRTLAMTRVVCDCGHWQSPWCRIPATARQHHLQHVAAETLAAEAQRVAP